MSHELLLALLSGALVSFMLGLVGGGGSILAIPLLVHVVGVRSPHVAIGVSAVSVAVNAFTNLLAHARRERVKWRCAAVFAASGVLGALAGSALGKRVDGTALLVLFGLLMVGVGVNMLRVRLAGGNRDARLTMESARVLAPRLASTGLATGAASGFFGIGGGFLITPSLMWATGMPMDMAIGSSLVAVTSFAVTTGVSYAFAGLVDWPLVGMFVVGGMVGALLGTPISAALAQRRRLLATIFAALVIAVGLYVTTHSITDLMS
ncbi:MAG TPA: sulfite exporter TauE/SafE family protein [Povalibacter sp.]|nr:sulfite exporter TauE/SafE family protein [Povalibacter sp.]